MKYVIIKCKRMGIDRYYGVVFSEHLVHADIGLGVISTMRIHREFPVVFSAGFCFIEDTRQYEVEKHGSESLDIKRDDSLKARDEKILNLPDAMQGMVNL